jgi:hypothetical protein
MVDDRPPYATHQEIEQLRDELRRLKEEQEKQKNGRHEDGQPKDQKKEEKNG